MKRYLCEGEKYAFSPTKIKLSRPCNFLSLRASILYTIGLFFMCLQAATAKEPYPESDRGVLVAGLNTAYNTTIGKPSYQLTGISEFKPLKIGQKLPANVVMGDPVFNADAKQITTRDFRRRAVIIDIWATWCGSCIAQFPKLDSLQQVYANHLNIYLLNNVYRDSENDVESFLTSFLERVPLFSLPLLVGNLNTRVLFPARSLPHYVWIDANGRVKAITGSDDVTGENIERLIAGLSVDAKEKLR